MRDFQSGMGRLREATKTNGGERLSYQSIERISRENPERHGVTSPNGQPFVLFKSTAGRLVTDPKPPTDRAQVMTFVIICLTAMGKDRNGPEVAAWMDNWERLVARDHVPVEVPSPGGELPESVEETSPEQSRIDEKALGGGGFDPGRGIHTEAVLGRLALMLAAVLIVVLLASARGDGHGSPSARPSSSASATAVPSASPTRSTVDPASRGDTRGPVRPPTDGVPPGGAAATASNRHEPLWVVPMQQFDVEAWAQTEGAGDLRIGLDDVLDPVNGARLGIYLGDAPLSVAACAGVPVFPEPLAMRVGDRACLITGEGSEAMLARVDAHEDGLAFMADVRASAV